MKTNHKLISAMLLGASIGAASATAMHARQATPPPAYIISEVDSMDLPGLMKYGEQVPATLAPFDGHYHFLVHGGASPQALDGGPPPKGIVVIAFENAAKAREWYDSPAYQAIKPLRLAASKGRMFIIEGIAP
jgi:uncharacterized protein (DUF1330 family)